MRDEDYLITTKTVALLIRNESYISDLAKRIEAMFGPLPCIGFTWKDALMSAAMFKRGKA